MNKPLTPAQRAAYRYPNMGAMGDAVVSLPASDLAALVDAADERDRLAADLDAMRERLAQGAALPQPVSDAAALHVTTLYAILSTPEGAKFRTMATNLLCLDPGVAAVRAHAVAGDLLKVWDMPGDTDEATARGVLADIGRRILAGEG